MSLSKKRLIEQWVVIALATILVFSLGYSKMRLAAKGPASLQEAKPTFSLEEASRKLKEIGKDGHMLKEESITDPLKKPPEVTALENRAAYGEEPRSAKNAEAQPILQGIIWGDKERLAIIDGNVVAEGDMLKDAKVLSISEDGVLLLKDGSKIELKR